MFEREMSESCFCGWSGAIVDRMPVYAGDGEWGLACPRCGHLDELAWLPAPARAGMLAEAARRREERGVAVQERDDTAANSRPD
jgi:hypothetical protein